MGIKEIAGRIGTVINHEINKMVEIISETRKGYNQRAILYNSSGEDSPPVKNDKLVLLKTDGTGKFVVVGVFNESQGAKPGEKIFYARSEGGDVKSKLSMLGDGSVLWMASDNFKLEIKKMLEIIVKENISIEGKNIKFDGDVITTGGSFECGGSVTPNGQGALCGIPYCLFTGAPQTGDTAQGT